jgi:hypothetical protein
MTKMHVIAKAGLMLIGIYVVAIVLDFRPIYLVSFLPTSYPIFLSRVIERLPDYLIPLLLCVVAYQLLVKGDKWSYRLIGPEKLELDDGLAPFAVRVYRMTAVFCGVLLIYHAVPSIEPMIRAFLHPEKTDGYGLTLANLSRFLLGFYLICGAPHWVRWQARKTLIYVGERVGDARPGLTEETPGKDFAHE